MDNTQAVETSEALVFDVREFEKTQAAEPAAADPGTALQEPAAAKVPPAAAANEPDADPPGEGGDAASAKRGRDPRINDYYKQQGTIQQLQERLQRLESAAPQAKPEAAAAKPAAVVDPKDPRPAWDPEKYKEGGYEDFVTDLSRWATREERKLETTAQDKAKAGENATARLAAWQTRVKESNISDYAEVVAAAPRKFASPHHGELLEAVLDSEVGPQIAYHFATNPDEVTRIDALPLRSQLRELGKLEARFESTAAAAAAPNQKPVVSKAPPPVAPLRGSAGPVSHKREEIQDLDAAAKADGVEIMRGRFAGRHHRA
jgi:hypothetical protein